MSVSLDFLTAGDNDQCISGHMELKNLARLPQATDAEMSFFACTARAVQENW